MYAYVHVYKSYESYVTEDSELLVLLEVISYIFALLI